MTSPTATNAPTLKRHPVRGGLYGLMLGVAVATYLIIFSVIVFQLTIPIIVVLLGVVVGILWAMFAPAKDAPAAPIGSDLRSVVEEPTFMPRDPAAQTAPAEPMAPPNAPAESAPIDPSDEVPPPWQQPPAAN